MIPKSKTVFSQLISSRFYLLVFLSFFFCKPEVVKVDFYPDPLPTIMGTTETLSDWKGKVIVLDFWATWCEPCAKAVPTINEWKHSVSETDFIFRGINTDTTEPLDKIKKDMIRLKMSYPTLLDKDWKMTDFYKVEGIPCVLVFDRSGKIVYRQYGLEKEDLTGLVIRSHVWAKSDLP
ncbi:TlpA family protein disulfide reductase [Leptospira levettii]|uniref:TlpA family protein disulfide reductase n=1 Tax=Leptospira levettii TaxID=2023178 RepID=UPI001083A818|nr:TlpA disulfide reductase family protein [Leptospira levettii]TGL04651.1 TlpA family protein disulfide reductase [Leptospira levettii]TGL14771.1 TlpA family protein disulfide reductase [Leptospira levettii]TGM28299.1 TlpA family protein disulfide reductase [Leptospira levettii]TGM65251.1 TlpA family protein disulfide reductase [Leptospira levettii]TGM93798.1 TlpA family protein disulfide reductase [Leptospira levettii]